MALEKIYDKIRETIDVKEYHIFIKNKIVVTGKSMLLLKENLKNNFNNPPHEVKCFIIRVNIKPEYNFKLMINCSQYTITPKLGLFARSGDVSQTFTYTEEELLKYKFKIGRAHV